MNFYRLDKKELFWIDMKSRLVDEFIKNIKKDKDSRYSMLHADIMSCHCAQNTTHAYTWCDEDTISKNIVSYIRDKIKDYSTVLLKSQLAFLAQF